MVQIREILDALGARPDPTGGRDVTGGVSGAASLDCAATGDLSFCTARVACAVERLRASEASLLIVDAAVLEQTPEGALSGIVVRSEHARLDFIQVLRRFFAPAPSECGIHESAVLAPGAIVGDAVTIGPLCTIAEGVEIGRGSVLHAGVHVYEGVRIGARVTINSGTVVGTDGYGFERDSAGVLQRFPHLGSVVIEDDVEIGSNVSIDRGTLGDTWIGPRARIDNLVHVAHNTRIGADAAIVAHAMLGGSSLVGARAWIAPCASLREGVSVGADALVGIGAVVTTAVGEGVTVAGNPARDLASQRAMQNALEAARCAIPMTTPCGRRIRREAPRSS